jgi:hypothetical protein
VNGSPPGLDASFFNAVETMLAGGWFDSTVVSNGSGVVTLNGMVINGAIQCNPAAVTVSGSISGTCTLYQYMTGTVKRCMIVCNNYRSASAQNLVLPVAFTGNSYWIVSELSSGTIEAMKVGASQVFSVWVTQAAAGGTQSSNTGLNTWSQGLCRAGFDTVKITVTSSVASSVHLIEGY